MDTSAMTEEGWRKTDGSIHHVVWPGSPVSRSGVREGADLPTSSAVHSTEKGVLLCGARWLP